MKEKTKDAKRRYSSTRLSYFIKQSPDKFWRYISDKENPPNPLPPFEAKKQAEAL